MSKRQYTQVQTLLPEIKAMIGSGKSDREIEAFWGLSGDRPIHNLLKQERWKEKRIAAGIPSRPKGRPRKNAEPKDVMVEVKYQIICMNRKRCPISASSFLWLISSSDEIVAHIFCAASTQHFAFVARELRFKSFGYAMRPTKRAGRSYSGSGSRMDLSAPSVAAGNITPFVPAIPVSVGTAAARPL